MIKKRVSAGSPDDLLDWGSCACRLGLLPIYHLDYLSGLRKYYFK